MLEPVIYTIEVPCDKAQAFAVFLEEMPNWWPLEKRSMSLKFCGKPAKSLHVDAKEGGKIFEITSDDEEHLWGTVNVYTPNDYIAMDFHMGLPPENASLVEVKFRELESELTEVELSQSNWEAFGDMAEMMRSGYGSSWTMLFEEAYKAACSTKIEV